MNQPATLEATQPRLIVWGAGELGGRVARLWRQAGGPVIAVTHSDRRHADLRAAGISPRCGDPLDQIQADDLLLLSLPGHDTQRTAVEQLVKSNRARPRRTVFLSTVGYYGPEAHGPIDEATPPGPDERSASIAEAEAVFFAWAGETGVVLRLGGLYAHNRGPISALARRKTLKRRPPDKTLALIHYDDAAAAIHAVLRHPAPERLYLAVTEPSPTRQEFYTRACRRLNLPAPEFEPPIGRPPARYDLTRLRRDLLPAPAYPDWQAALTLPADSV
ncbi:MAG TPA: hypothetical protein PKE64_20550 [Anaerolineae bacterium]|nr:hypothetical protein [Anaerolineae bacterium]